MCLAGTCSGGPCVELSFSWGGLGQVGYCGMCSSVKAVTLRNLTARTWLNDTARDVEDRREISRVRTASTRAAAANWLCANLLDVASQNPFSVSERVRRLTRFTSLQDSPALRAKCFPHLRASDGHQFRSLRFQRRGRRSEGETRASFPRCEAAINRFTSVPLALNYFKVETVGINR